MRVTQRLSSNNIRRTHNMHSKLCRRVLQQNVPGMEALNPDGGTHFEAFVICLLGFMMPYSYPPEAGELRAIFPLEGADKSCTVTSESSLAQETAQKDQGEDEVSSSQTDPTASSPDSENTTELGAGKEMPDGEPPASSSSPNCFVYISVISMLVLTLLS